MKITLENVLEWFENSGFVKGVHYEEQSIIDEIKYTLHLSEPNPEKEGMNE